MGKDVSFHIHVKSEHGYSPNHTEHVFSVVGLSLRRHGFDHKLRQITNCDGSVAICDCRNLWRFKIQLFRLMSIVPEGILLNAENMFTSTSDPIKKVSFVHRLWALKVIYIGTDVPVVLFHCYICLCVCISVTKPIIDVPRKLSWKGPIFTGE